MSLLLGLFPSEYWLNATCKTTNEEQIFHKLMDEQNSSTGQAPIRMVWKRCIGQSEHGAIPMPPIHVAEDELLKLLSQAYFEMFSDENMMAMMSKLDIYTLQTIQRYHRGSFVMLLRHIRSNTDISGDWEDLITMFLEVIINNNNLILGTNFLQELYLYLHLYGLFSADVYTEWSSRRKELTADHASNMKNGLAAWTNMPSVSCITLKILPKHLSVLDKLPVKLRGTPMITGSVEAENRWHNLFSAVQVGRGSIVDSGKRNSDEYQIRIVENLPDEEQEAPFLISFLVPSWMLLQDSKGVKVGLRLRAPMASTSEYAKLFGAKMVVYETQLVDHEHVFITKLPPNQTHLSPSPILKKEPNLAITNGARYSTSAQVVEGNICAIRTLTCRLDLSLSPVKDILSAGGKVLNQQISPNQIQVSIAGSKTESFLVHFPAFIKFSEVKTRIARKSSYIELIVPIVHKPWEADTSFLSPAFLDEYDVPSLWMVPRLSLDGLPVLDTAKQHHNKISWLNTNVSLMFSNRERRIRDSEMTSSSAHIDPRVDFKDSLLTLFMRYSNLQGGGAIRAFGLSNKGGGGVNIMVFASKTRLDGENGTVVLDCAILPLTEAIVKRVVGFLQKLTTQGLLCQVNVDTAELQLWKRNMPAFVERCRTWRHKGDCAYKRTNAIPLPGWKGQGKSPICSCGEGVIPKGFMPDIPGFESMSKYCTRAALSPIFAVSFVEEIELPVQFGKAQAGHRAGQSRSETSSSMLKPGPLANDACNQCGATKGSGGADLMKCAKCKAARYCSRECQVKDRKTHKAVCAK